MKNKNIEDNAFNLPLFRNDFDLTWMYMDKYIDKKEYTILPIENAIDDGTVSYSFNDDGFRSDNFILNEDNPQILFAGCSQTEGVGSPLETIWPKILLKNKEVLNFYSIARSGYGWQSVIQNYLIYESKYGLPKELYVLLPNIPRFYVWENHGWTYVQRYPGKPQKNTNKNPGVLKEKELTVEDHRRSFIDFCMGWKLFETYCKNNGVKLFWSTWDYDENKNIEKSGLFDNYVSLGFSEYEQYVEAARPGLKFKVNDLSRRDGHSGILEHEYWAKEFLAASREGSLP
jgi:hypothetical protein